MFKIIQPRSGKLFQWLILGIIAGSLLPARVVFLAAAQEKPGDSWYFLRDRKPVDPDENLVDVLAVGDVMLGRGVTNEANPFRSVAVELGSADFTVGNFEGAFASDREIRSCQNRSRLSKICLLIPFDRSKLLKTAGFDLLSLANNHSLDAGDEGLELSAAKLAREGIETVGAGLGESNPCQPVILEKNGIRIAFLAANAVSEPVAAIKALNNRGWKIGRWDWEKILAGIQAARQSADVVIMLVHWGDEYEPQAGPMQIRASQQLIEAGVDVVIGSHPHTIQKTTVYPGSGSRASAFAAFSLGNFVFDQYSEPANLGIALHFLFDKKGLRAVKPQFVNSGHAPRFIPSEEAEVLFERFRPEPELLAVGCTKKDCHQAAATQNWVSGRFTSGAIDLTGDGNDEQVLLQDELIKVFEQGKQVWQSPLEWKVLDAALGDPNLDGRAEIAIALLKADKNGVIRCHPFLIGYRGGIYRQVWGGSAVENPILEIEVADLDGDRDQELIVLEQAAVGTDRYVAVWRFNYWFFSRFWTSIPGDYSHIGSVNARGADQEVILVSLPW